MATEVGSLADRIGTVESRMRQMGERFGMQAVDARLGQAERDTGRQLSDLRQRVTRLEEERGPAA